MLIHEGSSGRHQTPFLIVLRFPLFMLLLRFLSVLANVAEVLYNTYILIIQSISPLALIDWAKGGNMPPPGGGFAGMLCM